MVAVTLFEFAVAELACRAIDRRRGNRRTGAPSGRNLAPFAAGVAGVYFGLIKGQEWAYVVVNHYADHFVR
ncbi:MAG: hypothetical protein AB2L13_04050 [Spirochaetota bacterium]